MSFVSSFRMIPTTGGRWKNSHHQHETYADTNIGFLDPKVAAAMCKGGVVVYEINRLSGVFDNWIFEHVVPNLVSHGLPRQVCIVFGHAVLFRLFDRTGEDAVPTPMRESIMRAYQDLGARNLLEEGCNPIRRWPLIVTGYDTEVMIDKMEMEGDEDEGGGIGADVDGRRLVMVHIQEVRLLSLQILHVHRELCDARTEGDRQITIMKRKLTQMSNNLTCFANRPGISGYKRRRLGNMQGGGKHRDHSSRDGDAAPIAAEAPVLGGEPRTSQQEQEDQDMDNNPFNADGGVEDANDPEIGRAHV